jgi:hypothetical protein
MEASSANLNAMTVDALLKLRGEVDTQLGHRRSELEKQLAAMSGDRGSLGRGSPPAR